MKFIRSHYLQLVVALLAGPVGVALTTHGAHAENLVEIWGR